MAFIATDIHPQPPRSQAQAWPTTSSISDTIPLHVLRGPEIDFCFAMYEGRLARLMSAGERKAATLADAPASYVVGNALVLDLHASLSECRAFQGRIS
jgi:hypothetical protein